MNVDTAAHSTQDPVEHDRATAINGPETPALKPLVVTRADLVTLRIRSNVRAGTNPPTYAPTPTPFGHS